MSYERVLQEWIQRLGASRFSALWQFCAEDGLTPEGLDDPRLVWSPSSSPFQFTEPKQYWFRCNLILPADWHGIPLEGAEVHLRGFVVAPTSVYINRKKVFHERFWSDFQKPDVIVTTQATPGEKYELLIHFEDTRQVRTNGDRMDVFIELESVEDTLFEIETFIQEMRYCAIFPELKSLCEEATALLESELTESLPIGEVLALMARVRQMLAPAAIFTKACTVHLVAHAHIDMNWLWDMKDTIDLCRRDFTTMLQLMDETPDFHFSQSQTAVYELMRRHEPVLFEKMRGAVARGNWDVTAATWTEGDLNMAHGEAFARHLLYSRQFALRHFGSAPRICWEPDSFGHPANLPQVLRKAGVDYYFHMRSSEEHPSFFQAENPLYWWEGLDGSRMLTFSNFYNGYINAESICVMSARLRGQLHLNEAVFVYGVGDHGGGPTRRDLRKVEKLNALPTMPSLVFSSTHAFFDAVATQPSLDLPVFKGEMNPIFDGCYTSHADIKRYNRLAERRLLEAETACALAALADPAFAARQADMIEPAWHAVLFNQFHDIFDGCAIHSTYGLACDQLAESSEVAQEITVSCLKHISSPLREESKRSFAVWNLLGQARDDLARIPLPEGWSGCEVTDSAGHAVPSQIEGREVWFLAHQVPALGYQIYHLAQAESPADGVSSGKANGNDDGVGPKLCLKTSRYEIEIERASGCIVTLREIATGRYLIRQRDWYEKKTNYNNLFSVAHEIPHNMSAWVIGSVARIDHLIRGARVTLKSSGPVAAIIEIEHSFLNSSVTEQMLVYKDLPRIDFLARAEWGELADLSTDAPMLQVSFMPQLNSQGRYTCGIPFGALERVADGTEYPAQGWIDISDGEAGFSLLSDGKYGFHADGNRMVMTCIRTAYSPDPNSDGGSHVFNYSLYPHTATWREAGTAAVADAFSSPLVAIELESGRQKSLNLITLPATRPHCAVQGEGVMLSSIKPGAEPGIMIVRIVRLWGETGDFRVELTESPARVEEVTVTEDRILAPVNASGNGFTDCLASHELKTYRIWLAAR